MGLELQIGKCTLLGNYRENNEDSIEVKKFPDMVVAICADGMGGQAAGEIASQRAIEVVPRELRRQLAQAQGSDQTKNVLRKAGTPASDDAIRRGVAWLKTNQRESGRWFTRSLNTDKIHYITHAGTGFAMLALRACESAD